MFAIVFLFGGSASGTEQQNDGTLNYAHRKGARLIDETILFMVTGPAFDAKLTQRIWAYGREMVGVGRYEQAGGGTGWFSMVIRIATPNNRALTRSSQPRQMSLMEQMSDGRLAWTRTQIGTQSQVRRVDVGRLNALVPLEKHGVTQPGVRIGGLVELLQRINKDYALRCTDGEVGKRKVWVLHGTIRKANATRIRDKFNSDQWPESLPQKVQVAIAKRDNQHGFGKGLPIRIEWSGPSRPEAETSSGRGEDSERKLISSLNIYDARSIPRREQRHYHFKFEPDEEGVAFTNDTERYLELYGVRLTAKDRVRLRR